MDGPIAGNVAREALAQPQSHEASEDRAKPAPAAQFRIRLPIIGALRSAECRVGA